MSYSEHHHHLADGDLPRIRTAFFLNISFALLELFFGWLTNSMAIYSDALHDLGDSLSLGMAWFLSKVSNKSGDQVYSYGYQRFSLLGALVNAFILIGGSVFILLEAIPRLVSPEAVKSEWMIVVAVLGMAVNGAAYWQTRGTRSMNGKVVSIHLLEDVLSWAAVLVASILIELRAWYFLDPALSIGIAIWMLINVIRNIRQTVRYFLQGVPVQVNLSQLEGQIRQIEGVVSLHHTHLWSLDGESNVFTTHIVVEKGVDWANLVRIKDAIFSLTAAYDARHSTVEVEYDGEDCLMMRVGQMGAK